MYQKSPDIGPKLGHCWSNIYTALTSIVAICVFARCSWNRGCHGDAWGGTCHTRQPCPMGNIREEGWGAGEWGGGEGLLTVNVWIHGGEEKDSKGRGEGEGIFTSEPGKTFCFFETWIIQVSTKQNVFSWPRVETNPRSLTFQTCSSNHCTRVPWVVYIVNIFLLVPYYITPKQACKKNSITDSMLLWCWPTLYSTGKL